MLDILQLDVGRTPKHGCILLQRYGKPAGPVIEHEMVPIDFVLAHWNGPETFDIGGGPVLLILASAHLGRPGAIVSSKLIVDEALPLT